MSLPSSGEIKASQMNTVAGRSATANAPLSGTSSTPQTGSLVKIYATANPAVNQSAPHSFSEFYGRSFVSLTAFLVGNPHNYHLKQLIIMMGVVLILLLEI